MIHHKTKQNGGFATIISDRFKIMDAYIITEHHRKYCSSSNGIFQLKKGHEKKFSNIRNTQNILQIQRLVLQNNSIY